MAADFPQKTIETFERLTRDPENFLSVDASLSKDLKENLKSIYDFSKSEEIKSKKSNALPELIIKNFDLEQIWQQIELQNEETLLRSVTNVSKLLIAKDKLVFKNLENSILEQNDADQRQTNDSDELELDDNENKNSDSEESSNEENIELNSSDNDSDTNEKPTKSIKSFKSSKVDDEFFKLSEMEQFLNAEEKKLADPDSGNDSESDSKSEASVDLFEANESEEEADDARMAKFKDYFVEKNEESNKQLNKRNKFLQELSDESDGNEENDVNQKSSLELRQERLNKRIQELENRAVDQKPWTLQGEITAENRPQNSLLEQVVEFDLTTRPAPVITEQTSFQLEDIIRQRIKDKVFDDVERKIKPVDTPLEYKKKLVLDQEKSKHSLAQIYEKEYLEQKESLDPENADKEPEEPELHKEVRKLMGDLFSKLDALSNFHFTPKPAIPELKVINNLPAINMEEVAPVATSDAAMLAPEEVHNKPKADVLGKDERTRTDKNRERRKKKKKQKLHLIEKEKREKLKGNKIKDGVPKKYKDNSKSKNSNKNNNKLKN